MTDDDSRADGRTKRIERTDTGSVAFNETSVARARASAKDIERLPRSFARTN
jgi:hypothetical protein